MTYGNSRNSHTPLYRVRVAIYACALSAGKWPTVRTGFNRAVLDFCNREVSEKTPQIFGLPLPAEYVTGFSGRTDAPEARCHCDLTDAQTHTHTHTTTVTLLRMRGRLTTTSLIFLQRIFGHNYNHFIPVFVY